MRTEPRPEIMEADMKTYRVRLMQTMIEEAWVTVNANTAEDAKDLAVAAALDPNDPRGDEWSFCEIRGNGIEAVAAQEMKETAS